MKPKGWKGESRRHSMARKGISTARGMKNCRHLNYDDYFEKCEDCGVGGGRRYPPQIMEETEAVYFHNYEPKIECDKGATDGEAFCWIDFGDEENYPENSQFVVVMDHDKFEVVDIGGDVLFRTDSLSEAIEYMKEEYILSWTLDAINSPMGRMLGWVVEDKAELTREGKEMKDKFTQLVMASGELSRKEMEKYLWHKFNDFYGDPTSEEVRRYRKAIAQKTDAEVEESYRRQVAIIKPLTKREQMMVDEGVDDLFGGR